MFYKSYNGDNYRVSDEVYTLTTAYGHRKEYADINHEQFRLISEQRLGQEIAGSQIGQTWHPDYVATVPTTSDIPNWYPVRKQHLSLVPDVLDFCLLPSHPSINTPHVDGAYCAVSSEIYVLKHSLPCWYPAQVQYAAGTKVRLIGLHSDMPLGWTYHDDYIIVIRANAIRVESVAVEKKNLELWNGNALHGSTSVIEWPKNLLNSLYKS